MLKRPFVTVKNFWQQTYWCFYWQLVKGKETGIPESLEATIAFCILQRGFKTSLLLPVEFSCFKDNTSDWLDFRKYFKKQVRCKRLFTGSFQVNLLLSLLDSEASEIVSAIGSNGVFFASCLKLLKWEFRNPYEVAYLKLK